MDTIKEQQQISTYTNDQVRYIKSKSPREENDTKTVISAKETLQLLPQKIDRQ